MWDAIDGRGVIEWSNVINENTTLKFVAHKTAIKKKQKDRTTFTPSRADIIEQIATWKSGGAGQSLFV